jgi:hypothetical protein
MVKNTSFIYFISNEFNVNYNVIFFIFKSQYFLT